MSTLSGQRVNATFTDLLQVPNTGSGFDGTLRTIQSGNGNSSALKVSSTTIGAGNITLTGNTVATSSGALTINSFSGVANFATASGSTVIVGNASGTTAINGTVTFGGTATFTDLTVSGTATVGTVAGTTITVGNLGLASNTITSTNSNGNISLDPNGTGGIQIKDTAPLLDNNGNEFLTYTSTASAVNNVKVTNAATGSAVSVSADGGDANIDMTIAGKGSGKVILGGPSNTGIQLLANQPIFDDSGNEYLKFSKASNAINEITIANGSIGNPATFQASGGDTNIYLWHGGKGTGGVRLHTDSGTTPCQWEINTTRIDHRISTLSTNRIVDWPDTDVANFLIQRHSVAIGVTTGTANIPADNSIPQITEGNQIATLSITPKSTANILVIKCNLQVANSAVGNILLALFQDSTASALSATAGTVSSVNQMEHLTLTYIMAAGTISATTFTLRIGTTSGTYTSSGSAAFNLGGVMDNASWLQIYEYAA